MIGDDAFEPGLQGRTNQWAMFLHLSLLAGFVVPLAGFVAPILIWQLKKEELPDLEDHGKVVINWMLSQFIYMTVSAILILILIGVPLFIAVVVTGIDFPIVGGIKASEGELWPYPLSIPFLK